MRLLVAGAEGMLGGDVRRAAQRAGHELVAVDLPELDVVDADAVARTFERVRPDAAVNCAAWTDVDGAESHREAAGAVNADGAGNLARAAARHEVHLVHLSTDYVFDGHAPLDSEGRRRPYLESDATGPLSAYGQSKLAGERQVLEASPRHTVVRSAWLFGLDGRNFVDTMLRLADEREAAVSGAATGSSPTDRPADTVGSAVRVVDDQSGCPTWTGHLAPALLGLIEREVRGVVHLAGSGVVTWNGLAREAFRQTGRDCRVEAATTAEMARPAPRPAWSALASERPDVIPMPDWRDGLAGYLAARGGVTRAA
jgi:dTDP-4-dehydrorhamnose reductase